MTDRKQRQDTQIVQGGRRKEWTSGIVNPPVYRASTVLFEDVAALHAASPHDGSLYYGRRGTPTTWSLAEALTQLEPGAAGTRLFCSGTAAISIALMTVLAPGDELLMVDTAYGPTRNFCDRVLKRNGVTVTYYDPAIGTGIAALIGPATKAIFLESPGSLTFEVQDVPGICALARERGIATLLDNTWATPILFPAIAAGVDLTILSCTKYIVGHSDVMLGSVTAGERLWPRFEQISGAFGQCASPDDAFLGARGLRTLGVRLRQHEANGLRVARWLSEQPQVSRVLHPALPDCVGHDYWQRDFKGASGLFTFVFKGGSDGDQTRFIDSLAHFGIGYSWGGFESLVLPVDPRPLRTATDEQWEGPLVRLHIGLEDADDLIEDLGAALASYPSA